MPTSTSLAAKAPKGPITAPNTALNNAPNSRTTPLVPNLVGTDNADTLSGDKNNNTYSAGAGNDLLLASSGNDSFSGGTGIDILDYSGVDANLTFARGGVLTKANDLGTDTITGFDIEVIRANPKQNNTIDGATGSTATLNINLATKTLTINNLPGIGSASLTVENFQNVNGSENADVIVGDELANVLNGNGGNDTISGGGGSDTFIFNKADSLLNGFDRITDLQIGTDVIDGLVTASRVIQFGAVSALTSSGISQILTAQGFGAGLAATFTLGNGSTSRTFLAMNDNQNGFQSNSDNIVEITGYRGQLSQLQVV
jgi:Ca2+-binding RTX toxin-like protein